MHCSALLRHAPQPSLRLVRPEQRLITGALVPLVVKLRQGPSWGELEDVVP